MTNMILLLSVAFLSGLITILAPCIWPLLPIVLSASGTGGPKKPLGVTLGICLSFAAFTLGISYLLRIIPFDPNNLRLLSVAIIILLGVSLIIPQLSARLESLVSFLISRLSPNTGPLRSGFIGGLLTGIALGLVWSPCAGPILATIAVLSATSRVNIGVIFVTLIYVTGVGIPLFLFSLLGNRLFARTKWFSPHTGQIQRIFGVIMIATALAIYLNFDKVVELKLLDAVPSYSHFLTALEARPEVQKELNNIVGKGNTTQNMIGQPLNNLPEMTLPDLGRASDFVGINNWLNTDKPLTLDGLKGKVVLVDFWTYTCINCLRSLPHVTSWYEKYQDQGFVVVGVHTPEFEFEKDSGNVQAAIKMYNIRYPVAQDNDYATWNNYANHYWPAEYLIDGNGHLRREHFGEGEYDEMEKAIQTLLGQAGKTVGQKISNPPDTTPKGAISPETYLGSARMAYYFPTGSLNNGSQTLTLPATIPASSFSLGGDWMIGDEYSTSGQNASLVYNFTAIRVFLVMRPGLDNKPAKVEVLLDRRPISEDFAGSDVKGGVVTIDSDRLYNLVDLKESPQNHLLYLRFQTPGTRIYAFTFG